MSGESCPKKRTVLAAAAGLALLLGCVREHSLDEALMRLLPQLRRKELRQLRVLVSFSVGRLDTAPGAAWTGNAYVCHSQIFEVYGAA